MADNTAPLALYRQLILLAAESAGLEWSKDTARIKEIAVETDALGRALEQPGRDGAPQVGGLYHCCEELSDVWIAGEIAPWPFAFHALDFLAEQLECHTTSRIYNLVGFSHFFGPKAVDQIFAIASDMMENFRTEWRRFEASDPESEATIYAKLNEEDERFDEAPCVRCSPEDEGATLISIASLDMDAFQGLEELIEERDALARRALRGEVPR